MFKLCLSERTEKKKLIYEAFILDSIEKEWIKSLCWYSERAELCLWRRKKVLHRFKFVKLYCKRSELRIYSTFLIVDPVVSFRRLFMISLILIRHVGRKVKELLLSNSKNSICLIIQYFNVKVQKKYAMLYFIFYFLLNC